MWQSPSADGRGQASAASPFDSVDPTTTGSTGDGALAYADASPAEPSPRAARMRPMGEALPQLAREAQVIPSSDNSSIVTKSAVPANMTAGAQRPDSPWLRAALLTPSVSGYMTATRSGEIDPRPFQSLFYKPSQSVMISFSADPSAGMDTDRFSGSAVVFVSTTTFTTQTTASLR
jgi:hypothetical protein